ncbi:hypothetical protein V498_09490 [Pseudogymnoascus sp. VKM F-4517 (FW-2822)]|nr:hypothetical protein V498_09490 [Pseudogymnoascus sp. VKM F-4517 (FW-2822)]
MEEHETTSEDWTDGEKRQWNTINHVNDAMLAQVSKDRLEVFAERLCNKYKALYQFHRDGFINIGDDIRRDQIRPFDSDIESCNSGDYHSEGPDSENPKPHDYDDAGLEDPDYDDASFIDLNYENQTPEDKEMSDGYVSDQEMLDQDGASVTAPRVTKGGGDEAEKSFMLKARCLKNKKPVMLSVAASYPLKIMAYFSKVLFHPDCVSTLEQIIADYGIHRYTDALITEPTLLVKLHSKGRLTKTDVDRIFQKFADWQPYLMQDVGKETNRGKMEKRQKKKSRIKFMEDMNIKRQFHICYNSHRQDLKRENSSIKAYLEHKQGPKLKNCKWLEFMHTAIRNAVPIKNIDTVDTEGLTIHCLMTTFGEGISLLLTEKVHTIFHVAKPLIPKIVKTINDEFPRDLPTPHRMHIQANGQG